METQLENIPKSRKNDEDDFSNLINNFYKNSPVAMYTTPIGKSTILNANDIGVKLFGYSSKKDFIDNFKFEDHVVNPSVVADIFLEITRNGKISQYDVEFYRKDKSFFWGSCTIGFNKENQTLEGIILDVTQRKESENRGDRLFQQLKNSESQYYSFLNSSSIGILLFEPISKAIIDVNPSFLKIFGFEKEDFLKQNLLDFIPESEKEEYEHLLSTLKENGSVVYETERKHKNGHNIPVEISLSMTMYGDAIPVVLENVQDISERKEAEEKLKFSDTIIKNSQNIVLAANKDGELFFASPSVYEFLGYTQDEILGNQWFNIVYDDPKKAKLNYEFTQKAAKGEIQDIPPYETWIKDKKGNDRCILWQGKRIEGDILVGIGTEITERKIAEQKLKKSDELQNGILSSLSAHIAVVDKTGSILSVNESWKRFASKNNTKNLHRCCEGVNYLDVCRVSAEEDKDAKIALEGILSVLEGEKNYFYYDYPCHSPNSERWFTMRVTPFGDREGVVISHTNISLRVTAQQKLKKQEQWYRSLAENATDCVSVQKPDFTILYNSPNNAHVFGYGPEDHIGVKGINLIHPEDKEHVEKAWSEMLNHPEQIFTVEYRFLHKNKNYIWIESKGKFITSFDGEPICIVNSRDISEKKQASVALAQSEEKFRSFTENAPNAILEINSNGDVLYINHAVSGFSVEEIIGQNMYPFIDPHYHEIVKNKVKNVFDLKKPQTYESKGLGPNNSIAWYFSHIGPICDKDGNVKSAIIITQDITEKKRDQNKKAEYADIMNQSQTEIYIFDAETLFFRSVNEGALKNLQFTHEEIQTLNPIDLKIEYTKEEFLKLIQPLRDQKIEFLKFETIHKRKDGSLYPVSINIQHTTFEGQPVFVASVLDISDLKKTEQLAIESEEKFRQVTETIEEAFWLIDWVSRDTLYTSPAYEKLYGIKPPQTKNEVSNWINLIHPEDRNRIATEFENKAPKGEYDAVFRIQFPDGTQKWVHEKAFPINKNGTVVRIAGYSIDITKQKLAENRLKESEERYRTLFERNLSGVYRATMNDVIIECNDSFAKIVGFKSKKEVIGKHARKLYRNVGVNSFSKQLKQNKGSLVGFESQLELNSGKKIWVLENASLIESKLNEPLYMEGTIIDITDLKTAESEVEELAKFPEQNPNPVLRVAGNKVVYSNAEGRKIADYISNSNKEIYSLIQEAEESNLPIETERKIGSKHYLISINPIREFGYTNIYGKDITERKKTDLLREITFKIARKTSSKIIGIKDLALLIHEELSKVLDTKNLYLALYDKESEIISFPYAVEVQKNQVLKKHFKSRKFGVGLTEHIISTRKHLLINAKKNNSHKFKEIINGKMPKSYLGVPLFNENEIYGVISIQSYDNAYAYDKGDIELIEYVGRQLSGLFERVKSTSTILQHRNELQIKQEKLQIQHKKSMQYQSMLLSSQLNPHFIFNALNSIQFYILDQDPEPALEYLSQFSTLMRSVMSNSTKEYITLESEINFLKMYIELEMNRFKNKFDYSIDISDKIEEDDLLIPPMLLQPFIENTIIHGVGNLSAGGEIKLEFDIDDGDVICHIIDNGVGRKEAEKLKVLRTGESHKSFSTKINQSRLDLLNSLENGGYICEIKDLIQNDKPAGTWVTIRFPLIQNE